MKYILGIDPGKTGAAAIINSNMEIKDIYDWQDVESANEFIDDYRGSLGIDFAVIEKVHAKPSVRIMNGKKVVKPQGSKSVWTFGENFGMWQALVVAHCIPYHLSPPQQWMAGQITPADHEKVKKRGLTVCRRLYPGSNWFRLEKRDGRADAVLIARYAVLNGLI